MLPVEQVLAAEEKYSANEVAAETGLSIEALERQWQAIGLPIAERDDKAYGEDDLDAARKLKQFYDAGLSEEGITQVARIIGEGMRRVADASIEIVNEALGRAGDTERDAGLRYAAAAEQLVPVIGPELQHVFRLHLRELVRNGVISRAELETGVSEESRVIAVCFADLVGFTRLGEEIPPEDLSRVAGRLTELAGDMARPPVRLVKTIGDAAMLVSDDAEAVVRAGIELVEGAEQVAEMPRLRAGVAHGVALERHADWYGAPVNTASRVTGVARPGSVLCTSDAREAAGDGFRWSPAGRRRLKGVSEPVRLFRARRPQPD